MAVRRAVEFSASRFGNKYVDPPASAVLCTSRSTLDYPLPTMLRRLLELIRFSHTVFALPFALLAAAMAWAANLRADPPVAFRWLDLLGILVCMVFARSAAMAFNRLADRRLDAINPRTQTRHLPPAFFRRAAWRCLRPCVRWVSWPARSCFCRAIRSRS